MEEALNRVNFLNRLGSLQKLCVDVNSELPKALLIVSGQDSRYNKGSLACLKYLFLSSVSNDLFNDEFNPQAKVFDNMVLLVKHSSLSVLWSTEVKNLLAGQCSSIPSLKEYLFDTQDPSSKITEFKRMMLESVKEKDAIGVTLPTGTINVQTIEGWPLMQGFANDKFHTSTGFLSSRYKIINVTHHIESLYRMVDGIYIKNALNMLVDNIKPCMLQTLSRLNDISAESRKQLMGSDLVDPLNALCAYGEVQSKNADPLSRPVVLFGPETVHFGQHHIQLGSKWESSQAGSSLHVVMEGIEPSTGLRWCRTYLLARGKTVEHSPSGSVPAATVSPEVVNGVRRLEALYVKLWLTSRAVVKEAFSQFSANILEAAGYIQSRVESLMREKEAAAGCVSGVMLSSSEDLEMHLDCINATGRIVEPEEVQSACGSCWVYLRLIVHGIVLPSGPVSVAVGDTYLFTCSGSNQLPSSSSSSGNRLAGSPGVLPLVCDGFCVTHCIPYYRCYLGAGVEEVSSDSFISAARNSNMLTALGLGKPLDPSFGAALVLPLLTDHPVVPLSEQAAVRLYSEGFVVECSDVSSTPVLLSLSTHVDAVWILDSAECMQQAYKAFPHLKSPSVPAIEAPGGLLIVFRLKPLEALTRNGSHSSLCRYNGLDRALPFLPTDEGASPPQLVGLFVRAKGAAAGAMASAAAAWRVACRVHKIQEHRTGSEVPLPLSILRSFLTAVDVWSFSANCVAPSSTTAAASLSSADNNSSLIATGVTFLQNINMQYPGLGCLLMRSMHALSVSMRLNSADFDSNLIVAPDVVDDEEPTSPAVQLKGLSAKKNFYKSAAAAAPVPVPAAVVHSESVKVNQSKEAPAASSTPNGSSSSNGTAVPKVVNFAAHEVVIPPAAAAPAEVAAVVPIVASAVVEVCRSCQNTVPHLQTELAEAMEIMKAQHEDNVSLSRAIEELHQQHDRDMREINRSVSFSSEEQRSLESSLKKAQQELRSTAAMYEKQMTDLKMELNDLAEQLKTSELQSVQKDSKIALLVQEYHLAEDRSERRIEALTTSNKELTTRLSSFGTDINSIQRAAQQSAEDYTHNVKVYEERIEVLDMELAQNNSIIAQQNKEMRSLNDKIANLTKNFEMEREHLSLLIDSKDSDCQSSIAQYEALLLRMKQEEERTKQFKSEANGSSIALRAKITSLEAEVESERRNTSNCLLDVTKAQADLMLLRQEKDDKIKELEGKVRLYNQDNRGLQDKYNATCSSYEERIRTLTGSLEETTVTMELKNDKLVEIQLDLVKKEAAVTVLTNSSEALKKEITALQAKDATNQVALMEMNSRFAEMEEAMQVKTSSLNTLNERYNTITKQYNALCSDVFKQSDSINKDDYIITNTKEVSDLQQVNRQLQETIVELQSQNEELERQRLSASEAHQSALSSMNTDLQRYSILVNQLQFSVSENGKQLAALEASKESEVNQLLAELTELNEENEKMNADSSAMSFELRGEIASLVEQLQDLEHELESTKQQLEDSQEEAAEKEERSAEALKQLQDQCALLQSQYSELTSSSALEVSQSNERVNMLVESLTSKAREAKALQEELDNAKTLLSIATNDLRAASAQQQQHQAVYHYAAPVEPIAAPTNNNSNIPVHVLAEIEALVAQGMSHDQAIETYFLNMNNKLANTAALSEKSSVLSDAQSEHSFSLHVNKTPFANSPAAPHHKSQGATPVGTSSMNKGVVHGSSSDVLLKSRSDSSSNLNNYRSVDNINASHSSSFYKTSSTTPQQGSAAASAAPLSSNSGSGKYDTKLKTKRDPDQEALDFALLLSAQESEFGVNMIDSLTLADEDAIKQYRDNGCSRAEAVLLVFQQKYGKGSGQPRNTPAGPSSVTSPNGSLRKSFSQSSSGLQTTTATAAAASSGRPQNGSGRPRPSVSIGNAINMEYSDYDEREIDRIMHATGFNRQEAAALYFKNSGGGAAAGGGAGRALSPLERRPSLPAVDSARSPPHEGMSLPRRPSMGARDLSPTRMSSGPTGDYSSSSGNRSRSPVPAVTPGGRQQLTGGVTSPLRGNTTYSSPAQLEANGVFPPHSSAPGRDRSPGPGSSGRTQQQQQQQGRPAPMQRSYTVAAPSGGVNGSSSFLDERSHSADHYNPSQFYHRK